MLHFIEEEEKVFEPYRWMRKKVMELVTPETLPRVIDECINAPGGYYALDTETEGLNVTITNGATTHQIVGVCLSPDGHRGYYIPLRHRVPSRGKPGGENSPHNISYTLFEREFLRLLNSDAIAIFHNGKFDHEVLQFTGTTPLGIWDDAKKWEDTYILCYLRNTKDPSLELKGLSTRDLRLKMIRLKELFPSDTNKDRLDFSTLDPTKPGVLEYAASDAIITYLLFWKVRDEALHIPETRSGKTGSQGLVYHIEKACVTATRWMERPGVKIDRGKIAELTELGQREYIEGLQIVYEEASKILNRDITPLSFVLLLERISERNPELRAYSSTSQADKDKNFGIMRDWAKGEAARLTKVWGIDGLEAKMLPSRYTELLSRKGAKHGEASYDVTIPGQLGLLIKEMGVPTEKTATGKVKTSRDVLDKITEEYAEEFPFLKKVRRFREIDRTLNVYLYYLYEDMKLRWVCRDCYRHSAPSHPTEGTPPAGGKCHHCHSTNIHRDDRVRVQFRGHKVDTGRFAVKAGKNPAKDGVCRVPFQGFPNQYDEERPECMRRMRETVIPDEGFTIVAIDYDGVELRIVTNLSREPKWMAEYFRCADCDHQFGKDEFVPPFCPKCKSSAIGDLHTLTALGVYGQNARSGDNWKRKRQAGKNTNFSLCYGGSWKAVQRQTQCSEREAKRIKDKFDGMYKTLPSWWRQTRAFAKRRGYVLTAFGRKYPLPDATSHDNFLQSKALRNAINSPVQGSSADITKLAMANIYRKCKELGWIDPMNHLKDKVRMLITLHDELVFEIANDILEEAIEIISKLMTNGNAIRKLGWPVPLTVDTELGPNWSVPFNLRKYQYGIKPWPEELRPLFPKAVAALAGEVAPETPKPEPQQEQQQMTTEVPVGAEVNLDAVKEETVPPPVVDPGPFVYRADTPWTIPLLEKLADAIVQSRSDVAGTELQVESHTGEQLSWPDGSVRVDSQRFRSFME